MKHVFILALALLAGCASVGQVAERVTTDGTVYRLKQQSFVTMGGKLKEGQTDFHAEYVEGKWSVTSGTGATGLESPNTVRDVTGLIGAIGALPMLQRPPEPAVPVAPETVVNIAPVK